MSSSTGCRVRGPGVGRGGGLKVTVDCTEPLPCSPATAGEAWVGRWAGKMRRPSKRSHSPISWTAFRMRFSMVYRPTAAASWSSSAPWATSLSPLGTGFGAQPIPRPVSFGVGGPPVGVRPDHGHFEPQWRSPELQTDIGLANFEPAENSDPAGQRPVGVILGFATRSRPTSNLDGFHAATGEIRMERGSGRRTARRSGRLTGSTRCRCRCRRRLIRVSAGSCCRPSLQTKSKRLVWRRVGRSADTSSK